MCSFVWPWKSRQEQGDPLASCSAGRSVELSLLTLPGCPTSPFMLNVTEDSSSKIYSLMVTFWSWRKMNVLLGEVLKKKKINRGYESEWLLKMRPGTELPGKLPCVRAMELRNLWWYKKKSNKTNCFLAWLVQKTLQLQQCCNMCSNVLPPVFSVSGSWYLPFWQSFSKPELWVLVLRFWFGAQLNI